MVRVFGDFSHSDSNVRLIAPLVPPQHPEGGQIALINLPSAALAGLTAVSSHATAKVDREPAPAAEAHVGPRVVNEAAGLRSRAIAFEVADAKPADVQASTIERPSAPLSPQMAAINDDLPDAPTFQNRHARSESRPEAAARQQRTHDVASGQLVETERAATPTITKHSTIKLIDNSEHPANTTHDSARSNAALAATDVAMAELGREEAAPIGDSASTSPDGRGRRVLAMALVLTAGLAPLGRVLRHGMPHKLIEQRPPRRRWPKIF